MGLIECLRREERKERMEVVELRERIYTLQSGMVIVRVCYQMGLAIEYQSN